MGGSCCKKDPDPMTTEDDLLIAEYKNKRVVEDQDGINVFAKVQQEDSFSIEENYKNAALKGNRNIVKNSIKSKQGCLKKNGVRPNKKASFGSHKRQNSNVQYDMGNVNANGDKYFDNERYNSVRNLLPIRGFK